MLTTLKSTVGRGVARRVRQAAQIMVGTPDGSADYARVLLALQTWRLIERWCPMSIMNLCPNGLCRSSRAICEPASGITVDYEVKF